jgi:hypothetical protein
MNSIGCPAASPPADPDEPTSAAEAFGPIVTVTSSSTGMPTAASAAPSRGIAAMSARE